MEENELYDRIGETDLNPTYKDGQVYQHTDINNQVSIVKTAVNENYYDIQKLQKGEKTVGNSKKLDGATLSRYIDEELQADDDKIPSSQQAKAYMDTLFAGYSAPVRGVDYWTEADQQQIVSDTANSVISEITPDLEEALAAKANINDIPTKISDLQNDSDFLSENNLQMVKSSDIQNGTELIDATGYSRLNRIYGDTVQNGTPSPDNPIAIQVVTGDVSVVVSNSDNTLSQEFTLSLGDIELCKSGDIVDYIFNKDNRWYIYKSVGKFSFNGTETWKKYTGGGWGSSSSYARFQYNIASNSLPSNSVKLSNLFKRVTNGNWNVQEEHIENDANYINVGILKSRLSADSVDGFKQWLSSNNLFVYYLLSTVLIQEITDPTLVEQLDQMRNFTCYAEQTNFVITSDNLLPSLNISYAITTRDFYSKEEVNDLLDTLKLKTKDHYFDSVADMCMTSLKVGDIAITTGYHSSNDGGGAKYKIVNNSLLVDDDGSVITLNNGYKAVLIVENDTINIKQFGAYGDNTHDDTTPIQNALKFRENDYLKILFNKNGTYLCQGDIFIYSNTDIDLDGSTIKSCSNSTSTSYSGLQFLNNIPSVSIAGYGAIKNFNVKNGLFHGGTSGISFPLFHAENFNFENLLFQDCFVPTHIFDFGGCKDMTIKNCKFIGFLVNLEANNYREIIQPDYARSSSVPYWNNYTTPNFDDLPTVDMLVENCTFEKGNGVYYPNAIGTHAVGDLPHENITIRNCKFYGCTYSSIRLPKVKNALIENNLFYDLSANRENERYALNLSLLNDTNPSEDIKIINNKFMLNNDLEGNLICMGVIGRTGSLIKNVLVKNNYFSSNYDADNNILGADGIQVRHVDNILVDGNTFDRVKNAFFKGSGVPLNILTLVNNTMKYCRDFYRSSGSASTEPDTNIVQSNNVWEDSNGRININEFVVTFTISEDITVDTNGVFTPPFVSDNPFITITEAGRITIPTFIQRFSYDLSMLIDPGESGLATRECHSFVTKNNLALNRNYNNSYQENRHFIKVPTSYYENKNMVDTVTYIVPRTTLKTGDIIRKVTDPSSNFPGTTITIKGY